MNEIQRTIKGRTWRAGMLPSASTRSDRKNEVDDASMSSLSANDQGELKTEQEMATTYVCRKEGVVWSTVTFSRMRRGTST